MCKITLAALKPMKSYDKSWCPSEAIVNSILKDENFIN